MTSKPQSQVMTEIPYVCDQRIPSYQQPPPPIYQQHDLRELIERPATPPAFLDDLPERQDKRLHIARRWIMIAGILLFLLFTAVLVLSILLAFSRKDTSLPSYPSPLEAPQTKTQTTTYVVTQLVTQTNWTTSTLQKTTTAWTSDVFTWTQDNPITITVTSFPQPTSTGEATAIVQGSCETETLYLANSYCMMVNSCNETQADVKSNDCLDFCRPGLGLQLCQQTAATKSEKESNCCDHCGCSS